MLKQNQSGKQSEFFLGIFLLFGAIFVTTLSVEITKNFFGDITWDKPYFSSYFKTSLLSIYLIGFLIQRSWRKQCIRCACDDYPGQYLMIAGTDTEDTDDGLDSATNALSEPIYVPAEIPSENECEKDRSKKHVKFNRLKEVRELEDSAYAHIARMSHFGALRARFLLRKQNGQLSISHTAKLSAVLSLLLFIGTVCHEEALRSSENKAIINILFSFVTLFALIFSALFPSDIRDQFSFVKFFAVCTSIGGVVLITASEGEIVFEAYGTIWSLVGSVSFALYLCIAKRIGGKDLNVFMLLGFNGLFIILFFWPGLFALHYGHIEKFVLPSTEVWIYLLATGIPSILLVQLLWLYGCLFTSPFITTLSSLQLIPLPILVDIIIKKASYPWKYYAGAVPIFLIYILVVYSESGRSCCCCRKCKRSKRLVEEELQLKLLSD